MSGMPPHLRDQINRNVGTKTVLIAKIEEFMGHAQMNNPVGIERCRNEAHALLDAYFDQIVALQHDVRKMSE